MQVNKRFLPVFNRGRDTLDQLEIRVGKWEQHDIHDIQARRFIHEAVYLDSADISSVALLGGYDHELNRLHSVLSLRLARNRSWHQSSSLPRMNVRRRDFGLVCIREKLYAIGGGPASRSFEVLDLRNLQAGWILHRMPDDLVNMFYCKAVAVDDRYIFVHSYIYAYRSSVFSKYDTQSGFWKCNKNTPFFNPPMGGYGMVSIAVPGKGTYVVVIGRPSILDAYHVESQTWFQLPGHPNGRMHFSAISSVENRYILVAGGEVGGEFATVGTAIVSVFDWVKREWFEFPSLPEGRFGASSVIIPGPINKWIITGGASRISRIGNSFQVVHPNSFFSLDVSAGIGWAQEKLLLLCFRGRSQKKGSKKTCPLEDLPTGIFANVLLFLMTPFPHEVQCKGSIFASLLEEESHPSAGKRSSLTKASKKPRIS